MTSRSRSPFAGLGVLSLACMLALPAAGLAGSGDDLQSVVPGARGRIVFAAQPQRGAQGYSLVAVRPDTGVRQTWVGQTRAARPGINPKWSRWGSRVAFVRGSGANRDIYVMNADGSAVRRLTTHPSEDLNPAWSANDEWLAFTTKRDGNYEVYKLHPDRPAAVVNLTKSPGREDEDPSWSPDASRIVFQSSGDLRVMRADGGGVTTLTSQGMNVSPAWSPNGRQIAFATNRDGNWEIYVMDADGRNARNLTRTLETSRDETKVATDLDPAWSPDGRHIAFTSNRSGTTAIHVMTRDGGGEATRISQLGDDSTTADWKHEPSNVAQLRRHVKSGVLRIKVGGDCYQLGTGFLVGPNLVATADHVLDGATEITLWRAKRIVGQATLIGRDPHDDVALLRTDATIRGYRFTFAGRRAKEEEQVAALGYFPGTSNVAKVDGRVRQVARRVPFDEDVPSGFSGGPLVRGPSDQNGDIGAVLGLIVQTIKEGSQTLAVPAGLVQTRLTEWRSRKKKVEAGPCTS